MVSIRWQLLRLMTSWELLKKEHIYLNKSAAGKIKKDVKGLQKLVIAPKLKN